MWKRMRRRMHARRVGRSRNLIVYLLFEQVPQMHVGLGCLAHDVLDVLDFYGRKY